MAEPSQYTFDYKEIVEALVKKQGLHEGLWQLIVSFEMAAVNVGSTNELLSPAAVVRLTKIGLTKTDKENNLTVDASVVNPRRESGRKSSTKK
jgi:hypothetical protein